MRQHLIVMSDGGPVDPRTQPFGELDGWQLPQPAEQALRASAHQHDLAGALDPDQGPRQHRELGLLLARCDHRQRVGATIARGGAASDERADQAAWRSRRAQRRAELHQPLVEITRCRGFRQRGHQFGCARPQRLHTHGRLDVVLDREHAGEHASNVAIDEWCPFAGRDRRDRTRGVRPDTANLAELGGLGRQLASVLVVDLARPGP